MTDVLKTSGNNSGSSNFQQADLQFLLNQFQLIFSCLVNLDRRVDEPREPEACIESNCTS